MRLGVIYFAIMLLFAGFASAHNEYLFNVSFDYNPQLKMHAIRNAQIFLNTTEEPVSLDLDQGMVSVDFKAENGERERFVLIADNSYSVQGFYDLSLVHTSGNENSTEEQRKKIAENTFITLPENVRNQLEYLDEEKTGEVYNHKWVRKINGILVLGDQLEILVDGVNGNTVGWRLGMFDFPAEGFSTKPSVSFSDALDVARKANNNDKLYEHFKPYLVIAEDGRFVWLFMLFNPYVKNYYVAVDAVSKELVISGTSELEGEIPSSYQPQDTSGSSSAVIISAIGSFILIGALALIFYKTQRGAKK